MFKPTYNFYQIVFVFIKIEGTVIKTFLSVKKSFSLNRDHSLYPWNKSEDACTTVLYLNDFTNPSPVKYRRTILVWLATWCGC